MAKVLVVDDEANLRKVLAAHAAHATATTSPSPRTASRASPSSQKNGADIVVTDLGMPKVDGMELLQGASTPTDPDVPVIMITAHGTVDTAVEAIKLGAFDYIAKPFEQDRAPAASSPRRSRTHDARPQTSTRPDGRGPRRSLIGESPQIQDDLHDHREGRGHAVDRADHRRDGTGKELIATRAARAARRRRDKPFIKINCAAIPKDLMESELFGYERGAFTGAVDAKPGRFELADGGTLFLDEIGEIPVEMQVKLLRVLQESEFERVGGIKTIQRRRAPGRRDQPRSRSRRSRPGASARTSTTGSTSCRSTCPPLRERRERHPAARRALRREVQRAARTSRSRASTDEALALLAGLRLAGQHPRARERDGARARSSPTARRSRAKDLPEPVRQRPAATAGAACQPAPAGRPPGETGLKDIVRQKTAELEQDLIAKALEETGGNVTRAAKLLQISRKSLQTKMKEFGLRDDSDE